jgi:hypothetical protein
MRPVRIWGILALAAFVTSVLFALAAGLSFRTAIAAKIDRIADLEQKVVRPAAASRLASALLERRLAQVSEPGSQAVAAAFQHSPVVEALADYRAAGGDAAVAAEAEKSIRTGAPPGPDSEIALMRAVRALASESARTPRSTRPPAPPSASRALRCLLAAEGVAAAAALLAYAAGRHATA